ncbi:hypothetical protein ACLOJK_020603 [Asimina triloba]
MQVIDPPGCLGSDCDAPDPIQLFLQGCVLPMEVLVQRPKSHEFIRMEPFPTFFTVTKQTQQMGMVESRERIEFVVEFLGSLTKNFSEKLGGGGFGSIFRGTLPDLTTVAVKMLEGLCQGEKQFRMEVSTIGTIQHVNLIRLRGFCSDGDKKLLVYDYMPNGSLNSHLFGTQKKCLDWSRRYQIAIETARALAYLHEKCRDCIIHCDIKPENILLDDGFGVKIADFGLAKLFVRDFSHVLTTTRGTIGYLAPEWLSGLAITTKADVYNYGMTVFEIISGRRNREESVKGQTMFFSTWAMSKMSEGDDRENERPSMGQIVQILEGVFEITANSRCKFGHDFLPNVVFFGAFPNQKRIVISKFEDVMN